MVELSGPSPMPNIKRTTKREAKLNAAPVNPQNTDHAVVEAVSTRFGPTRSDK